MSRELELSPGYTLLIFSDFLALMLTIYFVYFSVGVHHYIGLRIDLYGLYWNDPYWADGTPVSAGFVSWKPNHPVNNFTHVCASIIVKRYLITADRVRIESKTNRES